MKIGNIVMGVDKNEGRGPKDFGIENLSISELSSDWYLTINIYRNNTFYLCVDFYLPLDQLIPPNNWFDRELD